MGDENNYLEENLNTDRAIEIANCVLDGLDHILDKEGFPEEFSTAELLIGFVLATNRLEKDMHQIDIKIHDYVEVIPDILKTFLDKVKAEVDSDGL